MIFMFSKSIRFASSYYIIASISKPFPHHIIRVKLAIVKLQMSYYYYYYYLDLPLSLSLLSLFEWLLHLVCLLSSVPCAPQKSLSHTNSLVLSKLMVSHKALVHCIYLQTSSYSDTYWQPSCPGFISCPASICLPINLSSIHPTFTDQPIHLYFFVHHVDHMQGRHVLQTIHPGLQARVAMETLNHCHHH